ncbi:MAG: LysM domain-containing protein, partial [Chloroflexota bacterium]
AALRVYADDTIEDPQAFASEPDTLPWEYCTGNRPPPESWVRYEIRRGQTLFELAQRTSGTVEQIALVNCIADVRAVAAGRSVFLPSAP